MRGLLTCFLAIVAATPGFTSPAPDVDADADADAVSDRALAVFVLKPLFTILDCDDEDTIEKIEIDEHFGQVFGLVDRDRSLTVSQGEYARAKDPAIKAKQLRLYRGMDSDGNGSVSAMEYRRYLHRMIEIADQDRDGEVARRDLELN